MPCVVGIYVSSTYLAITLEVWFAVGCVSAYMCKNIWTIIYTHKCVGCLTCIYNVAVTFVH